MEPIFYGRGSYTVEAIKELRDYSFSPRWRLFIEMTATVMIFFGTIPMIIYRLKIDFQLVIAGIILLCAIVFSRQIKLKYNIFRLKLSGEENIDFSILFFEEYFELIQSNGSKFQIYYKHICRIAETMNLFGLYTKKDVMFCFFKDSLIPYDLKQWKKFIKDKNKKIYITIDKGAGGKRELQV